METTAEGISEHDFPQFGEIERKAISGFTSQFYFTSYNIKIRFFSRLHFPSNRASLEKPQIL
jgi:hypothetical protein